MKTMKMIIMDWLTKYEIFLYLGFGRNLGNDSRQFVSGDECTIQKDYDKRW